MDDSNEYFVGFMEETVQSVQTEKGGAIMVDAWWHYCAMDLALRVRDI